MKFPVLIPADGYLAEQSSLETGLTASKSVVSSHPMQAIKHSGFARQNSRSWF